MLTSPNGKTYIGQTVRPIEVRLEEHETGKSKGCRRIYNAIQYHGWENIEKDWYYCPDEDLNKHEELMVEVLGTLTPGGYNLREGGGNHGKASEETKQKCRESKLGDKNHNYGKNGEKHHNFGIPRSKEVKQKISEALLGEKSYMFGIPRSKESKQKQSEALLGDKHHKSKRVYQYSIDGVFIDSFGSVEEAGRNLDKDGTHIGACARGVKGHKTAYKFKWSYTLEIFI